jgi:tetratricopeptide (TPR) repeat protein
MRVFFAFLAFLTTASSAMAMDLQSLWNFNDPVRSEQRFRAALATASADEAFILQTQIARTYGLRGEFTRARDILKELEPRLPNASIEARTRYWLELGRTYSSATHPPESQTAEAREKARRAYNRAYESARYGKLDALAVDALHMLAFVDTKPADQLRWGQKALAIASASSQPAAKAWEASLRNNIGYALYQLGRYEQALAQFQQAVVLRERGNDAEATRIAYWMVAWTLRALGRIDEALAIQLRLEAENKAADTPDPEVYDELEHLYHAKGDEARAKHYAALKEAAIKQPED